MKTNEWVFEASYEETTVDLKFVCSYGIYIHQLLEHYEPASTKIVSYYHTMWWVASCCHGKGGWNNSI